VGLVGARRRRQGLGPFVARDLVRAGARVPCFAATSAATRDAASGQLAATCGIEARGYTNVDEMLARERLDALAILSPAETHAAYLESALAAGLHVLCEKPLVWGRPDLAADGARTPSTAPACDSGRSASGPTPSRPTSSSSRAHSAAPPSVSSC